MDQKALLKALEGIEDARADGQKPYFVNLGEAETVENVVYAWRQAMQQGTVNPDVEQRVFEIIWPRMLVLPNGINCLVCPIRDEDPAASIIPDILLPDTLLSDLGVLGVFIRSDSFFVFQAPFF